MASAIVLVPSTIFLSWLVTVGISDDGVRTFVAANWAYPPTAVFDNTFATFATDYVLAGSCAYWAITIRCTVPHESSKLRRWSTLLLSLYAISTFLGGVVHQLHDGNNAELNSSAFRLAWTVVVGATVAAGGCFGLIGTELLRLSDSRVQAPNDEAWLVYICALVALVAYGALSCVRPAGDTFIGGSTQALPIFFLQACAFDWRRRRGHQALSQKAYWVLQASLVSNAPLVFLYPVLVQRTTLSLGALNAALHTWLAVSWAGQGWSLSQLVRASAQSEAKLR